MYIPMDGRMRSEYSQLISFSMVSVGMSRHLYRWQSIGGKTWRKKEVSFSRL